ncbi:predicted protein [Botrytis cinerea T4]|uniref:Uncharacterized protein n=1 Tax=Botryotinia fuckeliana (strain T4) TaxID=999810 RepID=G2XRX5_BOTF4|nr:predicted protein [Botrytis cinerea T4]
MIKNIEVQSFVGAKYVKIFSNIWLKVDIYKGMRSIQHSIGFLRYVGLFEIKFMKLIFCVESSDHKLIGEHFQGIFRHVTFGAEVIDRETPSVYRVANSKRLAWLYNPRVWRLVTQPVMAHCS